MKYEDKTKEQLINELAELHQRVEDLDAEATKRKKAEEALKVSETLDLVKNSSPAHHENSESTEHTFPTFRPIQPKSDRDTKKVERIVLRLQFY